VKLRCTLSVDSTFTPKLRVADNNNLAAGAVDAQGNFLVLAPWPPWQLGGTVYTRTCRETHGISEERFGQFRLAASGSFGFVLASVDGSEYSKNNSGLEVEHEPGPVSLFSLSSLSLLHCLPLTAFSSPTWAHTVPPYRQSTFTLISATQSTFPQAPVF
jgi:hypothetical protein